VGENNLRSFALFLLAAVILAVLHVVSVWNTWMVQKLTYLHAPDFFKTHAAPSALSSRRVRRAVIVRSAALAIAQRVFFFFIALFFHRPGLSLSGLSVHWHIVAHPTWSFA
jgi:hypothetical protein